MLLYYYKRNNSDFWHFNISPLQEAEIKKMAKSGNKEACKILAKQLVQLRKQKNRTYAVSSKVTSMSTQTKVMNSQMKMAGAMSTTAKVQLFLFSMHLFMLFFFIILMEDNFNFSIFKCKLLLNICYKLQF